MKIDLTTEQAQTLVRLIDEKERVLDPLRGNSRVLDAVTGTGFWAYLRHTKDTLRVALWKESRR